ncbi:GNAT family N-acetyltransferase [Lasiodiplodia theobromae]|uniref:GNAT family N-acetyltransferase n=1 Tax=Lasiodiplodia theobromae TaxID=45133 RepID=UPI0015C3897E|nr:GNAT family N-acetyltransferase [Lasiodiplodia theobromae]KAF4534986.1 GNAT family N-acetyltransferase [Lasiodiplodia theobromae]
MPSQPPTNSITLRTHRADDLSTIVSRHGAIYAAEYGWDTSACAALAARILDDFTDNYDPALERCWIAEDAENKFVGCVVLVKDRDAADAAKLRLLLVEPSARGMGVGKKLVAQCIAFAREAGYRRVVLWTQSVLVSARRIYKAAGFRMLKTEEHESFGAKVVGEFWELVL